MNKKYSMFFFFIIALCGIFLLYFSLRFLLLRYYQHDNTHPFVTAVTTVSASYALWPIYLKTVGTVSSAPAKNKLFAKNARIVRFYLPNDALRALKIGQAITIYTHNNKNQPVTAFIRLIQHEDTVPNHRIQVTAELQSNHHPLTSGTFASIQIDTKRKERYISLPQTAVSFNPSGDTVYIVNKYAKAQTIPLKNGYFAKQVKVTTGEINNNQIAILSGLKEGDCVIIHPHLPIKDGSRVAINQHESHMNSRTMV